MKMSPDKVPRIIGTTLVSKAEEWISQLLDQTLQISDLTDGFVFLQLLSLIAPEQVDVLDHISNHPSINYWNALYCILEANPALANWVQWSKWKDHVQSLINFTNHSIPSDNVHDPITNVLEHFFGFMSSSSYIFPMQKGDSSSKVNETNECTSDLALKDTDPNFLYGLFFLLSYCKDVVHEKSKAFQEICELINQLDLSLDIVAEHHFNALKQGHIYNLIVNHLFPKSISTPVISSLYQEPQSTAFLQIIQANDQALNCDDFLNDLDTHVNICFQLLQMCYNQFSDTLFPKLQLHLQNLSGYNPHLHTPFDLEDGFLVLLTLITNENEEFSDLFIDLQNISYWEEFQKHFNNHAYTLPPHIQSDSGKLIILCMLSQMFLKFSNTSPSSKKIRIKKTRLKLIDTFDVLLPYMDSAISVQSEEEKPVIIPEPANSLVALEPFAPFEKSEDSFEEILSFISLYEESDEINPEHVAESPENSRVITLSPTSHPPSPVLSEFSPTIQPRIQSPLDSIEATIDIDNHEEEDLNQQHTGIMVFSNDSFRPNKSKPALRLNKLPASMEVLGRNHSTDEHSSDTEVNEKEVQDDQKKKTFPHKLEPLRPLRTNSNNCNRRLITNALQICLAGTVNAASREETLEALSKSNSEHFVLLLRGAKHHGFKALYTRLIDQHGTPKTVKLCGIGPKEITEDDVEMFFKYDSGSRSFKAVPTKAFSSFIHAVSLNRNGSAKYLESK